jgi:hypothetical protein
VRAHREAALWRSAGGADGGVPEKLHRRDARNDGRELSANFFSSVARNARLHLWLAQKKIIVELDVQWK